MWIGILYGPGCDRGRRTPGHSRRGRRSRWLIRRNGGRRRLRSRAGRKFLAEIAPDAGQAGVWLPERGRAVYGRLGVERGDGLDVALWPGVRPGVCPAAGGGLRIHAVIQAERSPPAGTARPQGGAGHGRPGHLRGHRGQMELPGATPAPASPRLLTQMACSRGCPRISTARSVVNRAPAM
jgi:hypothetical protein